MERLAAHSQVSAVSVASHFVDGTRAVIQDGGCVLVGMERGRVILLPEGFKETPRFINRATAPGFTMYAVLVVAILLVITTMQP